MSEFTLNQNAVNFFMHSYFGIGLEELTNGSKDDMIVKCAKRAYRDLNRTLRFNDALNGGNLKASEKKEIEKQRENFCNDICKVIKEQIVGSLLTASEDRFDEKHEGVCDLIKQEATKSKRGDGEPVLSLIENKKGEPGREALRFHDGQAQKWLNMTLKYMWLIGLWADDFERLLPVLHVPVDSFIIEAVWHEDQPENSKEQTDRKFDNWTITLPCKKDKRWLKYSEDKVASWSKWTYAEYIKFQEDLRKSPILNGKKPIEWEGSAWINIAKKRSNQ